MNERLLFRKKELLPILTVLLLMTAVYFFLPKAETATEAIVEQNGVVIDVVKLPKEKKIDIGGEFPLTVIFSAEGVSVENASCKDKICMKTGKIAKSGESIICLPARISIRLKGGNGYDSVTY
ncbi:MAG: NusG domain II-containing protein [Oscillospiraceae bacterium]